MITEATLIPAAFAAATSIAQRLVSGLSNGISFERVLADDADSSAKVDPMPPPADVHNATQTAAGSRAQQIALQQMIRRSGQALHTMLQSRFSERGIDLQQPAVLEIDENGRFLESSGHSDRAEIELLLESDPELARTVRQFVQQVGLLNQQALSDSIGQVRGAPRLIVDAQQVRVQFEQTAVAD